MLEEVGVAINRILTELFFFFVIILSAKTAYALKEEANLIIIRCS